MRKHFYPNVKGLGNVAISRHAQREMDKDGISQQEFENVLLAKKPQDVPDGQQILWRQGDGIRIVIILHPEPPSGAVLVKTVYRIKPQAKVR